MRSMTAFRVILFPSLDEKATEHMTRLNLSQRPIISPS